MARAILDLDPVVQAAFIGAAGRIVAAQISIGTPGTPRELIEAEYPDLAATTVELACKMADVFGTAPIADE